MATGTFIYFLQLILLFVAVVLGLVFAIIFPIEATLSARVVIWTQSRATAEKRNVSLVPAQETSPLISGETYEPPSAPPQYQDPQGFDIINTDTAQQAIDFDASRRNPRLGEFEFDKPSN